MYGEAAQWRPATMLQSTVHRELASCRISPRIYKNQPLGFPMASEKTKILLKGIENIDACRMWSHIKETKSLLSSQLWKAAKVDYHRSLDIRCPHYHIICVYATRAMPTTGALRRTRTVYWAVRTLGGRRLDRKESTVIAGTSVQQSTCVSCSQAQKSTHRITQWWRLSWIHVSTCQSEEQDSSRVSQAARNPCTQYNSVSQITTLHQRSSALMINVTSQFYVRNLVLANC